MWMKGLLAGTTKQAFGDVQIREGSWDRDPVRLVWAEDVPDLREGVIRYWLRQRAVLDVPCALDLVRAGREGRSHWLALEQAHGPVVRTWIRGITEDDSLISEAAALSMVRQVAIALRELYRTTEHLPGGYIDDVLLGPDGTIRLGSLGELAPEPRLDEAAHVRRLVDWLRLLAGPDPSEELDDLLHAVAKGAKLRHLVRIIDSFLETCPQLIVSPVEWMVLVDRLQQLEDDADFTLG